MTQLADTGSCFRAVAGGAGGFNFPTSQATLKGRGPGPAFSVEIFAFPFRTIVCPNKNQTKTQ